MIIGLAEKIETIVLCFLKRGTTTGRFGTLARIDQFTFRVVVDRQTFIVNSTAGGWRVEFKGVCGEGVYVIEAATESLRAAASQQGRAA